MKYSDLQLATWLWLGWARRYLKAGTDQTDAYALRRLRAAYSRKELETREALNKAARDEQAAQAGKEGEG